MSASFHGEVSPASHGECAWMDARTMQKGWSLLLVMKFSTPSQVSGLGLLALQLVGKPLTFWNG